MESRGGGCQVRLSAVLCAGVDASEKALVGSPTAVAAQVLFASAAGGRDAFPRLGRMPSLNVWSCLRVWCWQTGGRPGGCGVGALLTGGCFQPRGRGCAPEGF